MEGRKEWKRKTGYHRRSLSETAVFRYKTLIGPTLRARLFETQQLGAYATLAVINRINTLSVCPKGPNGSLRALAAC